MLLRSALGRARGFVEGDLALETGAGDDAAAARELGEGLGVDGVAAVVPEDGVAPLVGLEVADGGEHVRRVDGEVDELADAGVEALVVVGRLERGGRGDELGDGVLRGQGDEVVGVVRVGGGASISVRSSAQRSRILAISALA